MTARKSSRSLLCFAMLFIAWSSSSPAQGDVYGGRTFDRSPGSGPPGTVISVSGTGCSEDGRPYERAGVSLVNRSFDTRYQYYPIKEDGTWEGQFLVPSEAPPGSYKLSAMCQASDMVFDVPDQTFEVSEAASAPEPQAPSPTPKLVVPKARSSPSPPPPSSPSQPPPSMAEIATSSSPTPLVKAVPDSDDDVGLYPLVPLGIAAVALIVLLVSMVLRRRRSGKAADAVG